MTPVDPSYILLFFTENLGFFRFSRFFSFIFGFFSVSFETVCFGCFASIPKQLLKESIFEYFSENLGLFRFVSVCFGLFETPKQTEFF